MSELKDKAETIWNVIRAEIEAAISGDPDPELPLHDIKEFITARRGRRANLPTFTLIVLNRPLRVTELGANTGVAEMTVQFGITAASYKPETIADNLTVLSFALVDLFLANPYLFDAARDVRIVEVNPDDVPEGMDDLTQPWATVTISWDFEFLRP